MLDFEYCENFTLINISLMLYLEIYEHTLITMKSNKGGLCEQKIGSVYQLSIFFILFVRIPCLSGVWPMEL